MTAPSGLHGLIERLRAMANYESRGIDMADELLHMAAALERLSARTDTGGEMVLKSPGIDVEHRYLIKRGSDQAYVGSTNDLGAVLELGLFLVDTLGADGLGAVDGRRGIPDFLAAAAPATADAGDVGEVERLRAENSALRETLARLANTINIEGSPCHTALQAMDQLVADLKSQAAAALRPAPQQGER